MLVAPWTSRFHGTVHGSPGGCLEMRRLDSDYDIFVSPRDFGNPLRQHVCNVLLHHVDDGVNLSVVEEITDSHAAACNDGCEAGAFDGGDVLK